MRIIKSEKIEKLRELSSSSKIGIQIIWVITLIIIPNVFPGIIKVRNYSSLAVNIFLGLGTSIFYEIVKNKLKREQKNYIGIVHLQILTSVILLGWFLHALDKINGPFFSRSTGQQGQKKHTGHRRENSSHRFAP